MVFGVSGSGKSTFRKAIAGQLPKCAFIEVDELRYKVIGDLVAYSAGKHPDTDLEEYRLYPKVLRVILAAKDGNKAPIYLGDVN